MSLKIKLYFHSRMGLVRVVSLVVLMCLTSLALGENSSLFDEGENWELEYNKDGIEVYTRGISQQPIKAVKARVVIRSDLKSVASVLANVELLPSWISVLESSELLKAPDVAGKSLTYMVSDLPWPVKNRDALYVNHMRYNEYHGEVIRYSSIIVDELTKAKNPSYVRMPESEARWRARNLQDGNIEVELIAHADPGGAIPKWFANLVVIQAPKKTLTNLRDLLESGNYSQKLRYVSKDIFGYEVGL